MQVSDLQAQILFVAQTVCAALDDADLVVERRCLPESRAYSLLRTLSRPLPGGA
jgi:hypothetical protein